MSSPALSSAVPILASLDITKTIQFCCSVFGFTKIYEELAVYGIVQRDAVQIHFWACSEKNIDENTVCLINDLTSHNTNSLKECYKYLESIYSEICECLESSKLKLLNQKPH